MDVLLRRLQSSISSPVVDTAPPTTTPLALVHPYYPTDAVIPGYQANKLETPEVLARFSAGCLAVLAVAALIPKRVRPNAPSSDVLTALWFAFSGCMHLFFEGYFVYNYKTIGGKQDLFAQMWKEYALSDSRYLSQDPFVLCVEAVTVVVVGPLAFVTAGLIVADHPLRHAFQTIVSFAHLYGDTLYYMTSLFGHLLLGQSYSRPEPQYFWGYFVGLNGIWIVIPLVLLYNSVVASKRAFAGLEKIERILKVQPVEGLNGSVEKPGSMARGVEEKKNNSINGDAGVARKSE